MTILIFLLFSYASYSKVPYTSQDSMIFSNSQNITTFFANRTIMFKY